MASGKYGGLTQFGWLLKEVWIECGPSPMPCKLDKMLGRLNGYGPQWAVDNLSTVVGWMVEHARNRGMEYDEAVLGGLVTRLATRVLRDDTRRMATAVGRRTESVPRGQASTPSVGTRSEPSGSRAGGGEAARGEPGDTGGGGSPPVVEGSQERGSVQP